VSLICNRSSFAENSSIEHDTAVAAAAWRLQNMAFDFEFEVMNSLTGSSTPECCLNADCIVL
jgi:hypothetical protein